jgi:flagellar assembly protein FliH
VKVSPFLFARSFDRASTVIRHVNPDGKSERAEPPAAGTGTSTAEADEPDPPTPPLRHSDEDLERVREEAFAAGCAEGEARAASARHDAAEHRLAAALETVAERIDAAATAAAALETAWTAAAARFALAVVDKMLPGLRGRYAAADILAVFDTVFDGAVAPASLTVTVGDDLRDAVAGPLAEIAERRGFEGRITVNGESGLPPGDCRVAWTGGGMVREQSTLWNTVEAAVHRLSGDPHSEDAAPLADAPDAVPPSA